MRGRFGLPVRAIALTDHIILARSARRPVALLVDGTSGTVECAAADIVPVTEIMPPLTYVAGIAKLPDGTTLIHDLDTFLSIDEEVALTTALSASGAP